MSTLARYTTPPAERPSDRAMRILSHCGIWAALILIPFYYLTNGHIYLSANGSGWHTYYVCGSEYLSQIGMFLYPWIMFEGLKRGIKWPGLIAMSFLTIMAAVPRLESTLLVVLAGYLLFDKDTEKKGAALLLSVFAFFAFGYSLHLGVGTPWF